MTTIAPIGVTGLAVANGCPRVEETASPRKARLVMERLTKEQYRERAAAKVAAAQELLAAEVASLVTGDDWRRFLDFQALLHDYSANNVMLIFAQHADAYAQGRVPEPAPTYIAGFETWRALGRTVERGQHGYAVLAPMRSTRRQARDAEGNVRTLRRGDAPRIGETETRMPVIRGFTVATVFDASQTSGKNLPAPSRPRLLAGEAPRGLGAAVKELIESNGFSVDTVADASHLQGANGQTTWATREVLIRADMDDAAMVKTLIHEAAHVLLHQAPPGRYLARPLKEVEAESVAYVGGLRSRDANRRIQLPVRGRLGRGGGGQGGSRNPSASERGGALPHCHVTGRAHGGRQAAGH